MRSMKKTMYIGFVVTLLVCLLTGCEKRLTEKNKHRQTLNFFCWTEYMPQELLEKFENETGIHVNMSTYSSNEDMLAKVKAEAEGAYDIVVPGDHMVEQMINQGMLEELDLTKLPNLKNIGKEYLNPSYDDGNKYCVPYQGGVAAIAVNTSEIKLKIQGYDDLFDPSLKNSLVVLDDFRAVIGLAEHSIGLSMNETNRTNLSLVETKLLSLKDNIKLFDSDSPKSALISGDCNVGYCWSAEIALAMEENSNIKIVFPSEGVYLFMDNLCIPKGAKHYDEALRFINFILDAENSSMISEEYPYLNPNEKAVELLGDKYYSNPAKNPPQDVITKGERLSMLDPTTLSIYDEMWSKLKR